MTLIQSESKLNGLMVKPHGRILQRMPHKNFCLIRTLQLLRKQIEKT